MSPLDLPLAAFDPWSAGFSGLSPAWEQVIGRLHPPLVHMPIGLLMAAGFLALIGGVRGRLADAARVCLTLGMLAAVAAAASGWLFALHDEANDAALDTHRWAGLAVVGVAFLSWALGLRADPETGRASLARWLCVLLAGVVAFTGHEGGELVWGDGFASAPLEKTAGVSLNLEVQPASADAADASASHADTGAPSDAADAVFAGASTIDFAMQIEPILAGSCYKCHGPAKAKGRLRLDERQFVFSAEEPVIVPGDPNASELLRRVLLPDSDPDVMPAKGARLAPEQAQLLERWIQVGAPWPEKG